MTPAPGRCTRSGGLCRLASRAAPAPRDVSVGAMGHGGEDEAEGRAGGGRKRLSRRKRKGGRIWVEDAAMARRAGRNRRMGDAD